MKLPVWVRPSVALSLLVLGLIPVLIYWWLLGRVPALSAEPALEMLNDPGREALLVDVRPGDEYSEMHVVGSYSWPAADIASLTMAEQIPADFRGRRLLLICSSGLQSAQSVQKLKSLGVAEVYSIRGGLQKWIGASQAHPSLQFTEIAVSPAGAALYRPMSLFEQTAVVVSGFGFKPLHMLLSAVLGFVLLKQKASDLRIFGWGVLIFLGAEIACAVNYIFYNHDSYLAEYLHSYGMTLSFGFEAFALMHGLDERLLGLSAPDKRCILLPLCRGCVKNNQVSCKARTLFQLATAALAILAFLPLLSTPAATSYVTEIFGTPYSYCRLLLNQYFEARYLPLLTLLCCGAALLAMRMDRTSSVPLLARIFLAAALGAFGFGMFRVILGAIFSQVLMWADFWEELTELMFIGLAAVVLWVYRGGLLDMPGRGMSRSKKLEVRGEKGRGNGE